MALKIRFVGGAIPTVCIPKSTFLLTTTSAILPTWGLGYDDGPFNRYTGKYAALENPYAEPALYYFWAEHNNQKANLMPTLQQRNVASMTAITFVFILGLTPPMTTFTSEQAVAEIYWVLKAIKEATGVTFKCWRPPQGDVDDHIRAITSQTGLHTVMSNWDSQDWNMPAPGGGDYPVSVLNGYFELWYADGKARNQTVLEHELNSQTVGMTEKWQAKLQTSFNVIPALACNNVSQPC